MSPPSTPPAWGAPLPRPGPAPGVGVAAFLAQSSPLGPALGMPAARGGPVWVAGGLSPEPPAQRPGTEHQVTPGSRAGRAALRCPSSHKAVTGALARCPPSCGEGGSEAASTSCRLAGGKASAPTGGLAEGVLEVGSPLRSGDLQVLRPRRGRAFLRPLKLALRQAKKLKD